MLTPSQEPENSPASTGLALTRDAPTVSRRRIERSLAIAALFAMSLLLAALALGCKKSSPPSLALSSVSSTSHGTSQPIDTNTAMQGRARNRRVELQRQ